MIRNSLNQITAAIVAGLAPLRAESQTVAQHKRGLVQPDTPLFPMGPEEPGSLDKTPGQAVEVTGHLTVNL